MVAIVSSAMMAHRRVSVDHRALVVSNRRGMDNAL